MAGPALLGAGYATEAVRAAIRHAFGFPEAQLVFAEIHPDNVASRRVLEKAGLREAGRVQGVCAAFRSRPSGWRSHGRSRCRRYWWRRSP